MKKHITIPLFIPHAGCPNQCIFCNQHIVTGKGEKNDIYRINTQVNGGDSVPDSNSIAETVRIYLSTAAVSTVKELAFFGGSFTGLPGTVQEKLLTEAYTYKKNGTIDAIRLSTRPDYISSEILSRLKNFNVDTVELGVQSFDDTVLTAAKRGHLASASFAAIDLLKKEGFSFVIQLLPGLPGESYKSAVASARTAVSLAPGGVRIYPAVVLKDTPMEVMYRNGAYQPLTIDTAVTLCAELTEMFNTHSIPILKTGIHPLSDLGTGSVVAGPYHPAFGFLVRSRVRRNELEKMIDDALIRRPYTIMTITLPGLLNEEYIGNARDNLLWLANRFPQLELKFATDRSTTCPTISSTAF